MRVAQGISEGAADDKGVPVNPVAVTAVVIRDTPVEVPPPFSTESVEALAKVTAGLETSLGAITIGFSPSGTAEHVRNFLRLAALGAYDGTDVASSREGVRGAGTGMMSTRTTPLTDAQERRITADEGRFNDQPHDLGVVSMARQAEVDSASTARSSS